MSSPPPPPPPPPTQDESSRSSTSRHPQRQNLPRKHPTTSPQRSILSIPPPIKHLFDRFPLLTYPANDLPLRAPRRRDEHVLYIWATEEGIQRGGWAARSFNPACLKWQAYLRFNAIPHRLARANNHAAPSGALPFLIPAQRDGTTTQPVPSGRLQKWVRENCARLVEEPGDVRYEAYGALVEHRIRRAWLYTLYLSPNAVSLSEPLYILPSTANALVRLGLAHSLRTAAITELLKFSPVIDAATLYSQADEAFAALDALLGEDMWFFGANKAGWMDACVFAYTGLLLDEGLGEGWVEERMGDGLRRCGGLVAHRERIVQKFFGEHEEMR